MSDLSNIHVEIAASIPSAEVIEDKFFPALRVPLESLLETVERLRNEFEFSHLSNLTAVDYIEDGEFELIYHFYSYTDSRKLLLKCRIPRDKPIAPSVFDIYPTADWQEREAYDLLGIRFTGHPNLVRILLPRDYKEHPLRKDFTKKGVRR